MEMKKSPAPGPSDSTARSAPAAFLSMPLRSMPRLSTALLSLALLLSGCANHVRGRLIDLDSGEEIALKVNLASRTYAIEAVLADGRRIGGEFREVPFIIGSACPLYPDSSQIHPDSVVYGSGYLKDGKRVIDFEYWRPDFGWRAVGTAKDNQGRRFKLLL